MKHELRNVISGTSKVRNGAVIQSAASYLKRSTQAGEVVKESKHFKNQEAAFLKEYVTQNNLWVTNIDLKSYVSEGAEQKVYLNDGKHVIKLNDSIFYSSWEDYLHSLLLHNYFFPDTAYELLGFWQDDNKLYAVVKQPFVIATEKTDLSRVKSFMLENGFIKTKNNDYKNPDLGIILEDLHDENVLTKEGILQFIDTVFFITDKFYEG
ncbi:MAG: putative polyvalent protein kinase domain-containing protein [Bacteroidia bacterium]